MELMSTMLPSLRARMLGSTASTAWMAPHKCVSRQVR